MESGPVFAVYSYDIIRICKGETDSWYYIADRIKHELKHVSITDAMIVRVVLAIRHIIHVEYPGLLGRTYGAPRIAFTVDLRVTEGDSGKDFGSNEFIHDLSENDARLLFRTAIVLDHLDLAERVRLIRRMDVNAQAYRCPGTNLNRDSNILEESMRRNRLSTVRYLLGVGADGNIFWAVARGFLIWGEIISTMDELYDIVRILIDRRKLDLNAPLVDGLSIAEFFTCNDRTGDFIAPRETFPVLVLRPRETPVQLDKIDPKFNEATIHRCFSVLVFMFMRTGQWIETGNMPPAMREAIGGLQRTMSENLPVDITSKISDYLL